MENTTYKEYWKTIRREAKEKTNKKLGLGVRIFGILVGVISTITSSLLLGKDIMTIGIIALTTIVINILAWIIAWFGYFTYFRAKESVIAYNGLENAIFRKQEEIDILTKDTKLEIATIPDLLPLPIKTDSKKKYIGLEVHNLNKDKKIVELGSFSFAIFSHAIGDNGKVGDGVFPKKNFIWADNQKETVEIRPNGDTKLTLLFIENDRRISIGGFSNKIEEEAFFEAELIFKGKYEGENHFREHRENRAIYISKSGKVFFSNIAVVECSDMTPQMREALNFVNNGSLYINRPSKH